MPDVEYQPVTRLSILPKQKNYIYEKSLPCISYHCFSLLSILSNSIRYFQLFDLEWTKTVFWLVYGPNTFSNIIIDYLWYFFDYQFQRINKVDQAG